MAFSYPRLPEGDAVRLLTLKAGGFFDQLEGDLVGIAFSARPRYLALSYTWDDPTLEQSKYPAAFIKQMSDEPDDNSKDHKPSECRTEATLALNGHDVPVRHNLALALRYLRSATHPLTIWIDAICINQDDIDERNAQVALMTLVYSRAIAVVAWMGLNGPDALSALRAFRAFPRDVHVDKAMRNVYNRGNSKELAPWFAHHTAAQSGAASRNLSESRATEKEALERIASVNQLGDTMIMHTTYWQRIWVVQEVCLGQKVFFAYGPTLLVDEEAVRLAHQTKTLKVVSGMTRILNARQTRFTYSMRLETLIEEFLAQKCTNPRDKIYGVVGLANDIRATEGPGKDEAAIDYNGSEDVNFVIDFRRSYYEIWCDVVLYLFRSPYYFEPVYPVDEDELKRPRHDRLKNVVRFASLVQNTLQDEVERELASIFQPDTRLRGPKLFGHYLVPVRGYRAGQIIDLGPSYADFVKSSQHHKAWRTKWRKHYRKEPDLERLREMEERYAAKILKYSEADIARVARIQEKSFAAFHSLNDNGPLDNLTIQGTGADGAEILDSMSQYRPTGYVLDRVQEPPTQCEEVYRFLGTDHCMGLAPPGAAVGDWVIRFWDCDAAVIVHPEHNRNSWKVPCTLVGRADVVDILDRKSPDGDILAKTALKHNPDNQKLGKYIDVKENWQIYRRIDMVMSWHTLQRITAAVII
ncbi:heterokaryon incompatibility protein-domain-containing protein [Nemania serpens]|nr:heterokaryon incompatibility protein-domain-containing protein [Nemania serpens]